MLRKDKDPLKNPPLSLLKPLVLKELKLKLLVLKLIPKHKLII